MSFDRNLPVPSSHRGVRSAQERSFVIPAELIKSTESAVGLAVDTVVITNVLFKLKVEGPRTENPTVRQTLATDAKALITEHKTVVGDDVLQDLL